MYVMMMAIIYDNYSCPEYHLWKSFWSWQMMMIVYIYDNYAGNTVDADDDGNDDEEGPLDKDEDE